MVPVLSSWRRLVVATSLAVTLALPGALPFINTVGVAHAQAVSVDSSTLVNYTGTGWTMSLLPGWAPDRNGIITGQLPNGNVAVLIVTSQAADPSLGLPDVANGFSKGILTDPTTTALGSKPGQVDGHTALLQDYSTTISAGTPGVARVAVWIENSRAWAAIYLAAGTAEPGAAGLDMFSNQLLPTFSLSG